jgi:hypothetical protein
MKALLKQELGGWKSMAHDHWQEFQPTMFKELRKKGRLLAALDHAANQTALEMDQLMDAGLSYHSAWEAVRESYLLLPDETEDQESEPNPMFEILKELIDLNQKVNEAQQTVEIPNPRHPTT